MTAIRTVRTMTCFLPRASVAVGGCHRSALARRPSYRIGNKCNKSRPEQRACRHRRGRGEAGAHARDAKGERVAARMAGPPQGAQLLCCVPVSIESQADLEGLRRVGRVVALTLAETQRAVEPGITTAELDAVASGVLERHGARSAPRLVYGFPGTICISVGDEAVHGVPGARRLEPGDLVTLDVTAELGGYMADAAVTTVVPPVAPLAERLARTAEHALAARHRRGARRPPRERHRARGRRVRSGAPDSPSCARSRGTASAAPSTSRPRSRTTTSRACGPASRPVSCSRSSRSSAPPARL